MRTVTLTGGRRLTQADLNRTGALPADVCAAAEKIVDDVRARGDEAVREYCLRFDRACPESFRVPDELVRGALDLVAPEFLASLARARDQILAFHEREREQSWFTTRADGTMLGVKVTPGVRVAARPIRIAVPKGSLFKPCVEALEAAGLPTDELRDLGRKLIVRDGDVEYVIVRAQDAPAFVGHGGADCGICGRDSLVEAGLDLLQLVDLGFGGCRFVVAEPRDKAGEAERNYGWRGTVRVATKYPRITQRYYDSIGQQVDIVTLHGNIELGPIVGMADRIVDITATGTTLAENDLVIVDEVLPCTARFFAGPAAYRCDRRIRDLARRLAEVSHEGGRQ